MKKLLPLLLILTGVTAAAGDTGESSIHFPLEAMRSSSTVILMINPDTGIILDKSRGAQCYYGYPDLAGMNITEINVLPAEEIQMEMQKARSENRNFFNFRHRLSNGVIRDVEVSSYPMLFENRAVLVSRIRDVTGVQRTRTLLLIMYGFVLTGIIILAIVSNLFLIRIRRAKQKTETLLSEKETLLKEIHHRIKNNIAAISSLLSLQSQSCHSSEAKMALKDTISRVSSMRVLYEKLLIDEKYREAPVRDYIESLINSIIALYPEQAHITVDRRIADFSLSSAKLFPLGIIINELFTNIMKYAFTGREDGRITIVLDYTAKEATLTIQDNGNGLPEGFAMDTATGFGLTLAGMLAEQLQGSFAIVSDNGTKGILKFKL